MYGYEIYFDGCKVKEENEKEFWTETEAESEAEDEIYGMLEEDEYIDCNFDDFEIKTFEI